MTTLEVSAHKRARHELRNALRRGLVERRPCEKCGSPDSHGHHEDYAQPLRVTWLCYTHHRELHRRGGAR